MNVANLKLCKELYELSEWDDTYCVYLNGLSSVYPRPVMSSIELNQSLPAYDLGYLIRKLPKDIPAKHDLDNEYHHLILHPSDNGRWTAYYTHYALLEEEDTPEDAVCKLAIKLFKQNILTRETK